jgi:hypothetical protein
MLDTFYKGRKEGNVDMKKITAFAVALLLITAFCTTSALCADDFMQSTQGYGAGAWYVSTFGNFADAVDNQVSMRAQLGLKRGWGFHGDADWQFSDTWGGNINYSRVEITSDNFRGHGGFMYRTNVVAAGTPLNSRVNFSTLTFMARYNIYRTADGTIDFAVAPTWVDYQATVRNMTTNNLVINETSRKVIPCIGFSGKQRMADNLYLLGELKGMGYKDNRLIDFRTDLRYNVQAPGLFLTLGYRYYDLRLTPGTNRQVTQNWNGPMATIRYEF